MARPLRRVLIGLSIRLGISIHEVEQFDMAAIREYLAMLTEINKPTTATPIPRVQTPEEIQATFLAAFGKTKE